MERNMCAEDSLNSSALHRLRQLGGDHFLAEMIDLFLEYVPQRIEAALEAERRGDYATVARAGHALKSTAGNLGATSLHTLAVEIEQEAREGQREHIRALLRELECAFERARAGLEEVKRSTMNV